MKLNFDKNPTILNNFLNYLLAIENYSENTIKAYNIDLLQFFSFIKQYLKIAVEVKEFNVFIVLQVKKADIIAFLIYLNFTRNNNPYTRQRKLTAIRRFYKWLLSIHPSGYTIENPAKTIPDIEKVERIPRHLNLEQAKKIQNIFTLKNTKFPARNNAIISLFLNTGIRVSELININLRDINFEKNQINIIGKRNKERIVYFSNSCKEKLKKYIEVRNRNKKIINIDEPLFVSYQNKRIGIDGVEDLCAKAYKLLGLEDYGYTTHTLRHTAASLMYIYVKQDILLLKSFLGHASLDSTQIYTHVYNKQVKEAVDRHPLNHIEEVKKKVA